MFKEGAVMSKKLLSIILASIILVFSSVGVDATEVSKTANDIPVTEKNGYQGINFESKRLTSQEYEEKLLQNEEKISLYNIEDTKYWDSFSSDYFYNKLSAEEKRAWNELNQKCIYFAKTEADISYDYFDYMISTDNLYFAGWDSEDVERFISIFKLSHPQFFFLNNNCGVTWRDTSEGYWLNLGVYSDFADGSYRKSQAKRFCNKVDNWVSSIKKKSANLEEAREKAAFDILCNNSIYKFGYYDQSAYSLVCEGSTVCAGYAATFQMLMNAVGIDTIVVTSYDHAWNLVKIHGNWYVADATWADQYNYGYGFINYSYYDRSESTINQYDSQGHHITEAFWDKYKPDARYDALTNSEYESPYFKNGDYNWFTINKNSLLTGGCKATPIEAYNGARFSAAPSYVTNSGIKYLTVQTKTDTKPAVTINNISGLKIAGRAADALRLNWNSDTKADGYIIEQYKGGKWNRIARIGNKNTKTYRVEKLAASTTYKFRIRAFKMSGANAFYGNYAYVNGKTNPGIVSGLKIGGTAKDALRLNWNKNSSASGYIIEQFSGNSWKRIKKIESNKTVTYRVEKLSAKTNYKFRIKAYNFDGNTPLYGTYSTVSGKTNSAVNAPSKVSGLQIGGRANDAIRLNWNKNSTAAGYIIEQYKDGKWVRIARIGDKSTVTYRIAGLRSKSTYKFRMRTFAFDGKIPLYSQYSYIDGNTR